MGRLRPEQLVGSVESEMPLGAPDGVGGPLTCPRREGRDRLAAARKPAFAEVAACIPGGGAPVCPAASGRVQAWLACRAPTDGQGPAGEVSGERAGGGQCGRARQLPQHPPGLWITRTRHGGK